MNGRLPKPIIDRLRFVAEAEKSLDAEPKWRSSPSRSSNRLTLVVALRLDGVLRGGVSLRLVTPSDAWEEDVYGHLEVRIPGVSRSLRLNPVEWRPLRPHDNPPNAPPAYRSHRLWSRWLPFEVNALHGAGAFDQSTSGIAVPLPREPATFSDYADLCADLWRCPDLVGLAPPPWARIWL